MSESQEAPYRLLLDYGYVVIWTCRPREGRPEKEWCKTEFHMPRNCYVLMAILGKKVIGEPTGAVGDVIYRNRRGKTEMYNKPVPYEPSDSPEAKQTRGNFTFQRKTAAAIDKIFLLKELWKNSEVAGYASYEKQMTVNSRKISGPEDISAISLFSSRETV